MLRISVGNKWVITSDRYQFILNERKIVLSGEKKGQAYLEAVGYYSKIDQLVSGLVHFDVRTAEIKSISSLVDKVEHVCKLCQEAFPAALVSR